MGVARQRQRHLFQRKRRTRFRQNTPIQIGSRADEQITSLYSEMRRFGGNRAASQEAPVGKRIEVHSIVHLIAKNQIPVRDRYVANRVLHLSIQQEDTQTAVLLRHVLSLHLDMMQRAHLRCYVGSIQKHIG